MDLIVEPGSLLAASPDLLDRNFMHAVVLMCAHGEKGAHGLVLNRPSGVTIDALMPQHPVLSRHRFPVHAGGPVGLDTLQILHRLPAEIPGGFDLGDGVVLGADLDAVAAFLDDDPPRALRDVRFVLGYSGWGEGQLEAELAGSSWLPARMRAEWVFSDEPGALWRRVVRSLGTHAEGLEALPPDPSWN